MKGYDFQRRREFVDLVEGGMRKSVACKLVGITRPTGQKWLLNFYDNGYDGLKIKPPIPHTFPRRISPEVQKQVVATALGFPDKGACWISLCLKNEFEINVSSGKVQQILQQEGIGKRYERFRRLVENYEKDGIEALDTQSIQGLENISEHFRWRKYCRNRLGALVFLWDEEGSVSNSRVRIPFYIFLDACGGVVNIIPNLGQYFTNPRNPIYQFSFFQNISLSKHQYTDQVKYVRNRFYRIYKIPIKQISIPTDMAISCVILEEQLKRYRTKVEGLNPAQFFEIPFVREFKRLFRHEFLLGKLKTIIHKRIGRDTGLKIGSYIEFFLSDYNQNHKIPNYPSFGKSPYEFAGLCHKRDFHLPTISEVTAEIRKRYERK